MRLRVVVLERNKSVARKVARVFAAASAETFTAEDPAEATQQLTDAAVLVADTFDGDYVAEQLRANPRLRAVLTTAEPLKRSLKYLVEDDRVDSVLARKDFESPPRTWETMLVARRVAGWAAPPLSGYLDWGFSAIDLPASGTADRDRAVVLVQRFVESLILPRRVAEMFGELAHELLMNAMYDAPADGAGRPKYAADRKASIQLDEHERPTARIATDGSRLVLQVRDPFGRLERRHIIDGLTRGLASGELDRSHGGAGMGLVVAHHAASALVFDIARGRHTEVTAVLDVDVNLRELRTQAKSLLVWSS